MSKLEQMARAMWLGVNTHTEPAVLGEWDERTETSKVLWRKAARAAIEALREPTEAAVKRGADAGELYGNTDARSTWYAMVDEILDEPQT